MDPLSHEPKGRITLFLVGITTFASLLVTALSLNAGITIVFQNLYYIPIILASYYYPKRGLYYSIGLSLMYALLVTGVTQSGAEAILSLFRAGMFIAVALLVSYLSSTIHRQKARYQSIYESSEAGIFLIDAAAEQITEANPMFTEVTGYCPSSSNPIPLTQLFPVEGVTLLRSTLQKQGTFRHHEVRIQDKSGRERYTRCSVAPLEGTLSMCSLEDVTDRRQVERALLQSEQRLADLINFLPDATFAIDTAGRVIAWNRAIEEMTGVPVSEMLGKGEYAYAVPLYGERRPVLIDLIGNPNPDFLTAHYTTLGTEGEAITAETSYLNREGKHRILWAKATPLHDIEGNTVGAIESIRDVTVIRESEQAIRASEERFRGIFETAGSLILAVSSEGIIRDCNSMVSHTLGYTREALIGQSLEKILHPEFLEQARQCLQDILTGGRSYSKEYRMVKSSGEVIDVMINSSALHHGREDLKTIICVIDDVTGLKNTEEALRKANHQLNLLSSITRHDILNALTALAYYQELTREVVLPPDVGTYLEKQEAATRQIRRLIEFTRDYQDLGSTSPTWQPVGDLIRKAATTLKPAGILMSITFESLEILADPLLEKVFYSLIENAIRHGEHVTEIRFSCRPRADGLEILCEDNGAGIPSGDKEHIFRRGFGKHTGLGLFLSREILGITGLTIRETGEEGHGARFEIHIPKGRYRTKPDKAG
jgi:PAS domain S-box-containing protein